MSRWARLHRCLTGAFPLAGHERMIAAMLIPAGWLYGTLAALRVALYRGGFLPVYRAPVPLISIGNLAVGGTGKTPAVDLVVKSIQAMGKKVAVVSRGYGGRGVPGGVGVVSAGGDLLLEPEVSGDEPYLLARRNPQAIVVVAPKRARGVRRAVELGAEAVVLDDGFQHLAVARDLDIVLLDGRRPLGNGRVLPAGLLREKPAALARGGLFLLTRCGAEMPPLPPLPAPVLLSRHRLAAVAVATDGTTVPLASLAGRRGVAFAGIADPEAFFTDLRGSGLHLVQALALADHVHYGPAELSRLAAMAKTADYLITTEKDGVKLTGENFAVPCFQVPLRLEVQEERALTDIVRTTIDGGARESFSRTA